MPEPSLSARAEAAAESLRARHAEPPRAALILGTGLGGVAEHIEDATRVPYSEIPGFPTATVAGHAGELVLGRLRGLPVAAMRGRFHLYEGYSAQQVTFPVRVLRLLGAETLLVTNAAGGLAPDLAPGDLLLLRDHIGLPILAGHNPLIGPNEERWGPRFPAMSAAYDAGLAELARTLAAREGIPLREGIYAMVSGPSFETRAELSLLRLLGADAVGMSTVPEVVVARHMGMRVLACSCITNAALAPEAVATHEEVLAVAALAGPRLATLVEHLAAALATGEAPA